MKKILSLVLTLAAVAAVHAQGTFNPATYNSDPSGSHTAGVVEDLTVSGQGPTGHGLCYGNAYQAQYYIGNSGITGGAVAGVNSIPTGMSAVGSAFGFMGSSATDAANGAGYYEGSGVITTTFAGGSTVSLMLYAWKGGSGSTLANATVAGHSAIYQFILGGAGSPAGPPTSWSQNLGGGVVEPTIANFGIATTAPEPATIALGLMGVGALFIRRRK